MIYYIKWAIIMIVESIWLVRYHFAKSLKLIQSTSNELLNYSHPIPRAPVQYRDRLFIYGF